MVSSSKTFAPESMLSPDKSSRKSGIFGKKRDVKIGDPLNLN